MPIGSSIFIFLFFFLPGLFFTQSVFLFQRVSVEYADTLTEKAAYSILFAPIIHAITIFIFFSIKSVYGHFFFDPYFLQISSNGLRVFGAYSDVASVLFGNSTASQVSNIAQKLTTVFMYQTATIFIAIIFSALVSWFAINFFGGLPGLRQGVYGLTNGFLRRNLLASVMCRDPQHEGQIIVYSGIVNKIRLSRSGQIQHIFIFLPEKRVARFGGQNNNMLRANEFRTSEGSIIDLERLRSQLEESQKQTLGLNIFRLPLMFVDGADIVNVYFYPEVAWNAKRNRNRIKLVKFFGKFRRKQSVNAPADATDDTSPAADDTSPAADDTSPNDDHDTSNATN